MGKKKDLLNQIKELEVLKSELEKEEATKIESIRKMIEEKCEVNGIFCGVILTPKDIASIVQLALETKENVTIPYNLYPKE